MRAIQSLALGKMTQRVLTKEPKTKEIGGSPSVGYSKERVNTWYTFMYTYKLAIFVDADGGFTF